jgi:CBS domain containing-hemolysin-like protein
MTILILVLSEILPKTIGARYWRSIAPLLPSVLNTMILVLKPFIWMSDWIMKILDNTSEQQGDTRQEIKAMAQLGHELGELDDDESRVILNVLDLHDMKIRDIMTPRTVCEYVYPEETVAEFMSQYARGQFSRYPVLSAEDESPLGVVFRRDIIGVEDDKLMQDVMMKSPLIVTDHMDVESVMTQLMREHQHMAMVFDEYGTWMGIVTMEDIFETLIGKSIVDETDDIPNMRRFARKRWEKRRRQQSRQYD